MKQESRHATEVNLTISDDQGISAANSRKGPRPTANKTVERVTATEKRVYEDNEAGASNSSLGARNRKSASQQ